MFKRILYLAVCMLLGILQGACGRDGGDGSPAIAASELDVRPFCGGLTCTIYIAGALSDPDLDPGVWRLYLTYQKGPSAPTTCADPLLQGYVLEPGRDYALADSFPSPSVYTFKACAYNAKTNTLAPSDVGLVRTLRMP